MLRLDKLCEAGFDLDIHGQNSTCSAPQCCGIATSSRCLPFIRAGLKREG
jgi:hypothetical protein